MPCSSLMVGSHGLCYDQILELYFRMIYMKSRKTLNRIKKRISVTGEILLKQNPVPQEGMLSSMSSCAHHLLS
jgi:hypothetical protein